MPSIRRLLSHQLTRAEVEIVLGVLKAERKGENFRAGRLGFVESLVKRGWLRRDSEGSVRPGDETRALVMEASRKP